MQGTNNTKTTLKKNKWKDSHFSILKLTYKATVIKTA